MRNRGFTHSTFLGNHNRYTPNLFDLLGVATFFSKLEWCYFACDFTIFNDFEMIRLNQCRKESLCED